MISLESVNKYLCCPYILQEKGDFYFLIHMYKHTILTNTCDILSPNYMGEPRFKRFTSTMNRHSI